MFHIPNTNSYIYDVFRSFCVSQKVIANVLKSSFHNSQMGRKNLAVFDFDHTIVDDNSDTAVMNLVDRHKIPKEIKSLHRSDGWTAFMQGIFKYLHENDKTEQEISDLIKKLPEVSGMCKFIKTLNENYNFDVIIISDSNTFFIDAWLKYNKILSNVLKVFSNPAKFVDGLLKIEMYHFQDSCKLSTKNLCKGQIMDEFIDAQKKNGINYDRVIYCGDGTNDFCPILRLSGNDLAFVRDKYKCIELVRKTENGENFDDNGIPYVINAKVVIWNTAHDLLGYIQENFN